ncbi:serine/threonine protein kinase [Paenibacillus sp. MY03]|jgi:predicted Ser/Thr protein kinase|uniref:serine/threonine protein kinase n=1 Tax=Paenibacillus sp. MY03 TaxID=302980 RepID=UPI000B3C546C|nr:serine/threonine protein kinase [Paenibacillus sp. MY03]OUS74949.1 serine/threonine protein kinase [Paenibacillus sp. MY03]
MAEDWKAAEACIARIKVIGDESNRQVDVIGEADGLNLIGIGTDAAVFHYEGTPRYAYKVYSDHAVYKKSIERDVYERLAGIPYFPSLHGEGDNYLVISYEPGPTLQDCLTEGIPVPAQAIRDVEEARRLVRERGLNPRDIHLKNVILQNGRGKVLDVSEYVEGGNDKRWEHLVWAYEKFYGAIEGRRIPEWLLEAVKKSYNKLDQSSLNLEDIAARVNRVLARFK